MMAEKASLEQRLAEQWSRSIQGTSFMLGRSTGEWKDEDGVTVSQLSTLTQELVGSLLDALMLIAREVDELKAQG